MKNQIDDGTTQRFIKADAWGLHYRLTGKNAEPDYILQTKPLNPKRDRLLKYYFRNRKLFTLCEKYLKKNNPRTGKKFTWSDIGKMYDPSYPWSDKGLCEELELHFPKDRDVENWNKKYTRGQSNLTGNQVKKIVFYFRQYISNLGSRNPISPRSS